MKVQFLLFLVFIAYSHSQEPQYVTISNSLSTLRASTSYDYFAFNIKYSSSSYLYVFLLDYDYSLKGVSYCYSNSYDESAIKDCSFGSVDTYDSDTQPLPSSMSNGYYYRISLYITTKNYLIIRYSGRYSYSSSSLKVKGTYTPFIEKVLVDENYDKTFYPIKDINNYFYAEIGYPKSNYDYLYFYFGDSSNNVNEPIYFCRTTNNPEYYTNVLKYCYFEPIYYYEKNPAKYYDYSYRVNVKSYHGDYIIIKYSVKYSNSLSVKSLYKSSGLSTLAIVFITIAGVVFVSIIIVILCYYCKRKAAANNINYVPTQPAVVVPEQPALVVQTPSYPLVEQNNMYPAY